MKNVAIASVFMALAAGAAGAVTVAGGNGWIVYAGVPGGGIDHVHNDWWRASDGTYSIDLNSTDTGGVSGLLEGLTIGESYTVSFDMSGNPGGPKGVKEMVSYIDTTRVRSFYFDTTGNNRRNMNWESMGFKFTATATSQYLSFVSAVAGTHGAAIDNVQVELSEVPLPMSALLLLTGLGGLAAFRRKSA